MRDQRARARGTSERGREGPASRAKGTSMSKSEKQLDKRGDLPSGRRGPGQAKAKVCRQARWEGKGGGDVGERRE